MVGGSHARLDRDINGQTVKMVNNEKHFKIVFFQL